MTRRKKCRGCKETFYAVNTLTVVCSPPCAIEYAREQDRKERRRDNRHRRQQLKSLSELCSETQRAVNEYIRLRDAEKGCISCEGGEVTDAGHFFHAGSKYRTSRLRFDHRVIHGQCGQCNRFSGGGNIQGFIDGIVARYGQQYLDDLYELQRQADRGELWPLTKDEVRAIAAEHRRLAREMRTAA